MNLNHMNPYMFPYITPSFGHHRKPWTNEELDRQRDQYLAANRQILPGFGTHRKEKYEAFSYTVVEATYPVEAA